MTVATIYTVYSIQESKKKISICEKVNTEVSVRMVIIWKSHINLFCSIPRGFISSAASVESVRKCSSVSSWSFRSFLVQIYSDLKNSEGNLGTFNFNELCISVQCEYINTRWEMVQWVGIWDKTTVGLLEKPNQLLSLTCSSNIWNLTPLCKPHFQAWEVKSVTEKHL